MRREAVLRAEPNPAHLALVRLEDSFRASPCHPERGRAPPPGRQPDGGRAARRHHPSALLARGRRRRGVGGASVRRRAAEVRGCGAYLRPDVVWFGETLPEKALHRAWAAAYDCDVFLAVGTSNLVEPAASLPWLAAAQGATVAVVNTSMEGQRSGVGIHHLTGPASEVLSGLVERGWPV